MNGKKVCNYDFFDMTNIDFNKIECGKFFESLKNPYHVPVLVKSINAFKFVCESNFKIIKFETFLDSNGNIKIFDNKTAKKIGAVICKSLDELYLFISKQKNDSFKIMTKNISDNIYINKLSVVNTTYKIVTKNQMKGLAFLLTKIKAKYFTFWAPEVDSNVLNVFYKTLYKLNNNCLCEIKIKNTDKQLNCKIQNTNNFESLLFSELKN